VIRTAAVDGFLIYCWPEGSAILGALVERRLPVVAVDVGTFPAGPVVTVDDRGGAALAAGHLLELGHRQIAILGLELHPDGYNGRVDAARRWAASYHATAQRLAGYLEALGVAGIDADTVPIEERPTSESAETAAQEGALALLGRTPRPTAILAMSDRLAAGALQAAAHLGLKVPHDLSVIGFDDAPLAAQLVPPLATVRQPLIEKERLAAELLFRPSAWRRHVLPVQLVLRGTTAAPPRP
jgi:DNA-binding LacI/PurR family transcriptional regulator